MSSDSAAVTSGSENEQAPSKTTYGTTKSDSGPISSNLSPQLNLSVPVLFGNIILRILTFGYTIYISYICFFTTKKKSLFIWHGPLSALGVSSNTLVKSALLIFFFFKYSILMTESILCFSNYNILTYRLKYKTKVFLHWILLVASGIAVTGGFATASIVIQSPYHFVSFHAVSGLIAYILTYVAMLNGIPTKYNYRFRRILRPVINKIQHATFSLITYLLAMTGLISSLHTRWYLYFTSTTMFYVNWVAFVITTLYVVYVPILTLIRRIKGLIRRSNQLRA